MCSSLGGFHASSQLRRVLLARALHAFKFLGLRRELRFQRGDLGLQFTRAGRSRSLQGLSLRHGRGSLFLRPGQRGGERVNLTGQLLRGGIRILDALGGGGGSLLRLPEPPFELANLPGEFTPGRLSIRSGNSTCLVAWLCI